MSGVKSPASRRPDAKDYTKWEKPLPPNMEDFMNQYTAWKIDGVSHPNWKQKVVEKFEVELKEMIRKHWKTSSKTRKLFIAMNKDDVWNDFKGLDMHLTKRNLATLDPAFIPVLENHVRSCMTSLVQEIRTELGLLLDATYASDEDRAQNTENVAGSNPEHYYFESYGKHLEWQDTARTEFQNKFGVIETLRKRELFVQRLVEFEARIKKSPPEGKGTQNVNNWLPKFRNDAAKILEKANTVGTDMIKSYESTTGKTFLLCGQNYYENFLSKQKGQIAKVKSNFSYMTADILWFDNPGGGAEGGPIAQRVLDPSLEHLVEEGVAEATPPVMPSCSDDLKFTFEYY